MKRFKQILLNPHVMLPIMIGVLGLCVLTVPHITVKKNPSVTFPIIRVFGKIPNYNKTQISNLIVNPLMQQLRHDSGIKDSEVIVNDESLYIAIKYHFDVDSENRMWALKTTMSRLKSHAKLPAKTEFKFYQKDIETRIKPFIIGITWPDSVAINHPWHHELSILNHVRHQFSSITGIKSVDMIYENETINVAIDPTKMGTHQLRLIDVISSLSGIGDEYEKRSMTTWGVPGIVSASDPPYTPESLPQFPIQSLQQTVVPLGEFATVRVQKTAGKGSVRIDGKRSHLMGISLYPNAPIDDVYTQINALIDKHNQNPNYPILSVIHNQAAEVSQFVRDFNLNILIGSILILISLFLMTTPKMGVLTAIMLPLTSIISLTIMTLGGIQLQQVSLAGFIISLGLIVDNAIILQEVIDVQPKKLRREVAIYSAVKQVFISILVSTVTTMMAFAPVFFLKSEEGVFLRSLPISIWINLSVAFILSMTVLPFLIYHWPKSWRLKIPSVAVFFHGALQQKYVRILNVCFKQPWIIVGLIIMSLSIMIATILSVDLEVMPPKNDTMFYINIHNPGQSETVVNAQVDQIETMLLTHPDVTKVVSAVGQPIPRLDLSFKPIPNAPGNAQILIFARDKHAKDQLINQIKPILSNLPYTPNVLLASLTYSEVYRYPISIHLAGTNHYQLLGEAEKIRQSLLNWDEIDHAIIDGTDDVSTMHYHINHSARVQYGVPEAELTAWFQMLISPVFVGVIGNTDRLLPVQLEYGNSMPLQSAIKQIGIRDQWGNRVPMAALLELDFKPQMPELTFKNTLATVTILVKPISNANIDQLQDTVNQYIERYVFPPGITSDLKGQLETQTQVFSEFLKYAIAIVFIMYGLLVIRFRSFYQPLLIYITIPLSFAGSFLSIMLSGAPLTFIGLLGLTGLTGIVINDGILLIDTANQSIRSGHTVTYATIKAAKTRFFPVILTSVTTIIGLIPLLVTQNMFQQLALAFVSGLFSSTVFLLLIIPVLYQGGYLIGVVKSQPHTVR